MKKIILTLSFLVVALSAGAWNKLSYPVIAFLASKHLTPEAASATKSVLGADFAETKIAGNPLYLLYLSSEYAPMDEGEKSVLVLIDSSLEQLKKDKNDKEALLSLTKAVADMHGVVNVRIQGLGLSDGEFTVRRWNNRSGKMARYKDCTWKFLWNSYYAYKHEIFTAEQYAEDIDIYYGGSSAAFMKGTPDEWAADMAAEIRVIYSRNLTDNYIMRQEEQNLLEYTHDRLLAKAAYRLAAILNEIYK